MRKLLALALALALAALIGFGIGYGLGKKGIEISERRDTVTVIDTITIEKPVTRDSVIVRTEKVYVKVYNDNDNENENDNLNLNEDSVAVEIPITQKVYEDSTYKAWVSGFHANLDSINVYQSTNTITITKTIKDKKRFGVGIGVGVGTDGKGITPYIGIGIHYDLIGF